MRPRRRRESLCGRSGPPGPLGQTGQTRWLGKAGGEGKSETRFGDGERGATNTRVGRKSGCGGEIPLVQSPLARARERERIGRPTRHERINVFAILFILFCRQTEIRRAILGGGCLFFIFYLTAQHSVIYDHGNDIFSYFKTHCYTIQGRMRYGRTA